MQSTVAESKAAGVTEGSSDGTQSGSGKSGMFAQELTVRHSKAYNEIPPCPVTSSLLDNSPLEAQI